MTIKELRTNKAITASRRLPSEMAKRGHLMDASYRSFRVEHGKRRLSETESANLADVLGVPVAELAGV